MRAIESMTFDDFCKNFSSASACHLVNTSWFSFSQTWNEAQFYGAWCVGAEATPTDRSGGCSNHPNTFLRNPQFCLEVRADKDELMVMLQQGEGREEEQAPSKSKKKTFASVVGRKRKPNSIGFHLYKVELNRKYRVHSVWEASVGSCTYMASRNVFKTLELAKGRYLLLPTTFEPGQVGQFVLRMFTKTNVHFRELKAECPKQPLLHIFSKYRSVSSVLVQEGHNISTGSEATHLYFVLSSEGEKVKGHVKNEGPGPKWNQAAIFYHKSTAPKIKIQVYNKKAIHDDLVGEGTLEIPSKTEENKKSVVRVKLDLRHDKSNNHSSEVYVILTKSKNLKQF